jgi:hypothetical protein
MGSFLFSFVYPYQTFGDVGFGGFAPLGVRLLSHNKSICSTSTATWFNLDEIRFS